MNRLNDLRQRLSYDYIYELQHIKTPLTQRAYFTQEELNTFLDKAFNSARDNLPLPTSIKDIEKTPISSDPYILLGATIWALETVIQDIDKKDTEKIDILSLEKKELETLKRKLSNLSLEYMDTMNQLYERHRKQVMT